MSKNVLELYKIGSRVKLTGEGTESIYGSIIGINITGDNTVTYSCGWWNGRSYDVHDFSPNQIEVVMPEKFKIGFHNE
jgi:hypothetical protein